MYTLGSSAIISDKYHIKMYTLGSSANISDKYHIKMYTLGSSANISDKYHIKMYTNNGIVYLISLCNKIIDLDNKSCV
jgi:hypothetical protein